MTWFGVFLALALTAAVYRASLRTTAIAFAAALFFFALFGGSFLLFLVLALVWLAVFVPTQVLPLRQEWISRPLLDRLRARPSEAVSADPAPDVGAHAESLANGTLAWMHDAPLPCLTADEQAFLDGPVEDFCRGRPRRDSLVAAAVPVEYGGLGLSHAAQAAVLEKIASAAEPRFVRTAEALTGVYHAVRLIERFASPAQQSAWLTLIARGAWVSVLAQPRRQPGDAGDPALALEQHGLWKGRETVGLRLDFDKAGVAGADDAQILLVAVRLDGCPLWVWLPRATPGIATDGLSGCGVFVPRDHGFEALPSTGDRPVVSAAAQVAQRLAEAAARQVLDGPARADDLAQLATLVYRLEALRRAAADLRSPAWHEDVRDLNARAVIVAQRLGVPVIARPRADEGSRADPGAVVPAVAALCRAHPGANPAEALQRFDAALLDYAAHAAQTLARSWLLALTGGRTALVAVPARAPHGRIARYSAHLALLIAARPWLADADPPLSSRLGRIWGRLCAAAAVLRVFEHDGRPPADAPLMQATLAEIEREIEDELDLALHAVPARAASWVLRALIFPLGRRARLAPAAVQNAVAGRFLQPSPPLCPLSVVSETQERLWAAVALKIECAPLEARLQDPRLRQPRRWDRIHEALGLGMLTAAEAALLRESHNRTRAALERLSAASQQSAPAPVTLHAETDYEPETP